MTNDISVTVDPSNPGQFFACCGLLELADRLWPGAQGWFAKSQTTFHLSTGNKTAATDMLQTLKTCSLNNTMTAAQLARREEFSEIKKKQRTREMEDEKKTLDKLWRELPLVLEIQSPLRIDWFLDDRAGGSRFKTWAGQQSVIDIARSMKRPVEEGAYDDIPPTDWLGHASGADVTFNFDSDASGQASSLDVGFSLDAHGMGSSSRPLLELLAFIGLQRFRPAANPKTNNHSYSLWLRPLLVTSAAAVVTGLVPFDETAHYTFPLLYRTKYLKSFLPAQPSLTPVSMKGLS